MTNDASTNIAISAKIDASIAGLISEGLESFNAEHAGPDPTKPFWIVCRDGSGNINGGLQAFVQWDWLVIGMLWIRDGFRDQGLGSQLLRAAEQEALRQGCKRARLATMTFQAPGFHKKHGYVEVCRLADVPPGHSYIYMTKTISAN